MSKAFHFITVMLLHISFPMNESNEINDERRTSKGLKQYLVYMLYECILLLNNLTMRRCVTGAPLSSLMDVFKSCKHMHMNRSV